MLAAVPLQLPPAVTGTGGGRSRRTSPPNTDPSICTTRARYTNVVRPSPNGFFLRDPLCARVFGVRENETPAGPRWFAFRHGYGNDRSRSFGNRSFTPPLSPSRFAVFSVFLHALFLRVTFKLTRGHQKTIRNIQHTRARRRSEERPFCP